MIAGDDPVGSQLHASCLQLQLLPRFRHLRVQKWLSKTSVRGDTPDRQREGVVVAA